MTQQVFRFPNCKMLHHKWNVIKYSVVDDKGEEVNRCFRCGIVTKFSFDYSEVVE